MNRKTFSVFAMIVLLGCGILIAPQIWYRVPQGEKKIPDPGYATFTIASWDYPDEHGQGIFGLFVQGNASGFFTNLYREDYNQSFVYYNESAIFNLDASCAIKLDIRVTLNYSFYGLSDPGDIALGPNYIRLNVTLTNRLTELYSEENITIDGYYSSYLPYTWAYGYATEIPVILLYGKIYILTITYEIFY